MSTFKERLLTNWDLMRVVRLAIGVWLAVQAVMLMDIFVALFSAFFLYQAVTGAGCCEGVACYAVPAKKANDSEQDIEYKEVS